ADLLGKLAQRAAARVLLGGEGGELALKQVVAVSHHGDAAVDDLVVAGAPQRIARAEDQVAARRGLGLPDGEFLARLGERDAELIGRRARRAERRHAVQQLVAQDLAAAVRDDVDADVGELVADLRRPDALAVERPEAAAAKRQRRRQRPQRRAPATAG